MRTFATISGAAGLLLLAGCAGTSSPGSSPEPGELSVVAAFYPLQFVAETVAGDHATVTTLAAPGIEPHDLELSPAAVRGLSNADVVLYIEQFQPAVDEAVETTGVNGLSAGDVVALHDADHAHDDHAEEDGHDEDADDHAEEEGHDDHDHGATDPHFWLDPVLLAEYATAVAAEFSRLDPTNADAYTANGEALVAELTALDESFTSGLAECERREIVTSHEAFGYMAEAYDLEQIGIAGLDPEAEPSPARVREIAEIVAETGATTIFTESAVSTGVVEAIAQDTGAAVEVLSPVETVADGDDYIAVMERNLANLRSALACD